jgi:glycogen operon protein
LSWTDWQFLAEHADLHGFVRDLVALRKAHPALRQSRFLDDSTPALSWHGPAGDPPDWDEGSQLGCRLAGTTPDEAALLLLFNAAAKPVAFTLPPAPGGKWTLVLTTQEKKPRCTRERPALQMDPRSVAVLESRP